MEVLTKESRYLPALAALLLITLGATAWLLRAAGDQPTERPAAVEALLLAQAASLQSGLALAGNQAAFEDLNKLGGRIESLNTTSLTTQQNSQLQKVKTSTQAVLNGREDILNMRLAVNRLQERVPSFGAAVREFQELYPRTRKELPVAQSERLRLLANSLLAQMQALLVGSNTVAPEQIVDNEMELQQLIQALQAGNADLGINAVEGRQAADALNNIARRASQLGGAVRDGLALSDRVQATHQAGRNLAAAARALEVTQSEMDIPSGNPALSAEFDRLLALLAGAAALVLIMLILWVTSVWKQRRAQAANDYGEGDQAAILRLLDELGSLADGDLTVQATVTEDITGAIADSINYTIEALRDLVGTINSGAILLEDATKQTEASAKALAIASKTQSQQVKNASAAVKQMAASIDEVSADAERSSDVARHSVDVAHKGGEAVRRTIEGMNTIRETIQETSKRIKRLGESSQEIGDIVELINDIADQTNVLALNASIQASMAGEAGRGFAVVADEVQRLAERSANATRQIEVLVRTIQADTNEAVVSMERSTTDVVGGALLAENAGAALEEIEQVSNQIAMLVQNISGSAREQTESTRIVLENVEKLTDISRKAEKSAAITTKFINKLAALATKLRHSVAGFVLPGGKTQASQPEQPSAAEQSGQEAPAEAQHSKSAEEAAGKPPPVAEKQLAIDQSEA
jgi:twitching motility protein PilJ